MQSGIRSERRKKIKYGIRKKVRGTPDCPRLSVFRSNTAIYAQLVDDTQGKTLVSSSLKVLDNARLNLKTSKDVGKQLAEKAGTVGVEKIVFDRGGYAYHGNVKALAEGAREGGLKF